jgi:hypothetical protein
MIIMFFVLWGVQKESYAQGFRDGQLSPIPDDIIKACTYYHYRQGSFPGGLNYTLNIT